MMLDYYEVKGTGQVPQTLYTNKLHLSALSFRLPHSPLSRYPPPPACLRMFSSQMKQEWTEMKILTGLCCVVTAKCKKLTKTCALELYSGYLFVLIYYFFLEPDDTLAGNFALQCP